MVSANDPPAASVPTVQVRVPSSIEHASTAGLISQETPAGSLSVMTTSYALPGPRLVTVTVKLAVSPAEIVPFAAVLVMARSGQLTWIVAVAVLLPVAVEASLEAAVVAMLTSGPQSKASV